MKINPKILNISRYSLFWSWNIIFALLTLLILSKEVVWPVIRGAVSGSLPLDYALYSLGIFIIPLLSIIIGLMPGYRKNSEFLFRFFYAVEIPLFLLCLARLTLFTELNPGTTQLALIYAIVLIAYSVQLFIITESRHPAVTYTRLIVATLGVLIALYIALLCLFFAPPLAKFLITEFFSFRWLSGIFMNPFNVIFAVFLIFTASLFVGLPLAIGYLHSRHFLEVWREYQTDIPYNIKVGVVAAVTMINVATFVVFNHQQQAQIFAQYKQPSTIDLTQKQHIHDNESAIRATLTNAYLASYRYISTSSSSNLISSIYKESFGFSDPGFAATLQDAFNAVAKPFIYEGDFDADKIKAQTLYETLFDVAIDRAEYESIRASLKANWKRSGMEAGLIEINREQVLLQEQNLNVIESSHSAQIELNESYVNQTFSDQEILYYFSLPEHTVFTGMWLSDDPKLPEKYPYQVAPRGAAQKVYQRQIAKRRDPALLEQVGPGQYRLRVFPIPAKTIANPNSIKTEQRSLYLKLRFVQALGKDGYWHMPSLLERRNIYWNDDSRFTVNGDNQGRDDEWLPTRIRAEKAKALGDAVISLEPGIRVVKEATNAEKLALIPIKLAVLVDSSYSMNQHQITLAQQLHHLELLKQQRQISMQLYCNEQQQRDAIIPATRHRLPRVVTHTYSDADSLLRQCLFFGNLGSVANLASLQQSDLSEFDAIVLLTDQGSYEIQEHSHWKLKSDIPIWMIHLDHNYPYAYDDRLLDAIHKSGGGVADDIRKVYSNILLFNKNNIKGRLTNSALWLFINDMGHIDESYQDPYLKAIAAQQYILFHYQQKNGDALHQLDELHQLAIKHSIVTPFSSMIALVTDEQKTELSDLSKSNDRFDRRIESGVEAHQTPADVFHVTAVPEPEEWILLICAFILTLIAFRFRPAAHY